MQLLRLQHAIMRLLALDVLHLGGAVGELVPTELGGAMLQSNMLQSGGGNVA